MLFNLAAASVLASSFLVARADPTPTTPGGGDVFNESAECNIAWTPDTSGVWKEMEIQLMSGPNLAMIPMGVVATVDGTDADNASYSYPCPTVSPNSAIYFYQFTDSASKATYWTTRFTIADASGDTTPPSNTTQPGGAPTPWGAGVLISGLDASGSGSSSNSTAAPPATSFPNTSSPSAPASTPTSSPSSKITTSAISGPTHAVNSSSSSSGAASNTTGTSGASALLAGGVPVAAALAAAFAML